MHLFESVEMCPLIGPSLLKNFSIYDTNTLGCALILSLFLLLLLSEVLIPLLGAVFYVNNLNFICKLKACAE